MQKYCYIVGLVWLLWLLPNTPLLAQGQVNILVDSTNFLIGDFLELQVVINVPKGKQLRATADISSVLDEAGLEVVDMAAMQQQEGASSIAFKQNITVRAWEPKVYQLPKLTYYYIQGNDTIRVHSLPLQLEAKAPQVTGDSVFVADIKPLIAEKPNFWDSLVAFFLNRFVLAFLILLFIGIIGFAIRYWWARRAAKKDRITPEAWAREQLELLQAKKLWQQGDFQKFHTEVSYILRVYIRGRFGVKALELPIQEVLPQIKKSSFMNPVLYDQLLTVLQHADLIKFAKASPLEIANKEAIEVSYLLIETVEKQLAAKLKQK